VEAGPRECAFPVDLLDGSVIEECLRHHRIQVLFHLAGVRGAADGSHQRCLETNALGSATVLVAAARANVRRIVTVGSADEYGAEPAPQSEDLPLRPTSAYGISRAAGTQMALALFRDLPCPVVILRPFTIYGPGQPPTMFLSQAVRAAVSGTAFEMSAGTQRRDFVHVADVVQALMRAAGTPGLEGNVINIGSGTSRALADVARQVWTISGSSAELKIGARAAAASELYDTCADIGRARELLGWFPVVEFAAGLVEMIQQVSGPEDAVRADSSTAAERCRAKEPLG
jgi:nucleoside-diphosphate-sugar epimerase